jgi:ADP-ribose pyrophosphatase
MSILSERSLFKAVIFEVKEAVIQEADGTQAARQFVQHQGSAVVLPMDADGSVLLVSQFRAPVNQMVWELPAGRIDPGEKPVQAARRELLEETGLRAARWKRLSTLQPSPGYVREEMHLFLATGLTQGQATPEAGEFVHTRWFSRPELELWVDRGRIQDAKTLTGLLLLWRRMAGQPG